MSQKKDTTSGNITSHNTTYLEAKLTKQLQNRSLARFIIIYALYTRNDNITLKQIQNQVSIGERQAKGLKKACKAIEILHHEGINKFMKYQW